MNLDDLFEGANFGPSGETDAGRRGLMVECVFKHAGGYGDGHTINTICIDAGFIDSRYAPTAKGLRWAFNQIYDSSGGKTVVERLGGAK